MDGDSLKVKDPRVVDALTRALGHAPPFTATEYKSFDGALNVSGARDLSVLGQLTSLRKLQVFGSDLKALTAVASMRDLESLRIIACPITELDALRGLPRLEELEVSFTFVEDAAPIFTLPALRRARLLGNPLTRASYDNLRGNGKRPAPEQRPPAIQVTRPGEWEAGLHLRERGIALCFSAVDDWVPFLVKPGADWAAWSLSIGYVDSILEDDDRTTESILSIPWPRDMLVPASDLVSTRVIGDGADALGWIDRSDLPADEAAALRRFVSGFAGLTYYRDGKPYLARKEKAAKIKLPEWYRKTRMTLGFALPGEWVSSFLAERDSRTFRFEPIGYDDEGAGPKIKKAGFYPVAIASDRRVTFAIRFRGRDRRVYPLHEEIYLYGKEVYGETIGPHEAEFSSYAAMLADIVSIRREDGTVIERADAKTARPAGEKVPPPPAKKAPRPRGASKPAPKKRRRKS